MWEHLPYLTSQEEELEALQCLRAACDSGQSHACYSAAEIIDAHEKEDPRRAEALGLYEVRCKATGAEGCGRAAVLRAMPTAPSANPPPQASDELLQDQSPKKPGGLEKDVIGGVIQGRQDAVKLCYEDGLAANPDLQGRLEVSWTIGPTGAVVDATVTDRNGLTSAVGACVLDVVRRMRFPEPLGGGTVAVTFPWTFKARRQE